MTRVVGGEFGSDAVSHEVKQVGELKLSDSGDFVLIHTPCGIVRVQLSIEYPCPHDPEVSVSGGYGVYYTPDYDLSAEG